MLQERFDDEGVIFTRLLSTLLYSTTRQHIIVVNIVAPDTDIDPSVCPIRSLFSCGLACVCKTTWA